MITDWDNICGRSAGELAELVRAGDVSPGELVRAHLDRIQSRDPALGAVIDIVGTAEHAAMQAERKLRSGATPGPLHGVPFSVKDCLDLSGVPTTCGSLTATGHPARRTATAVARIVAAGGIPLAKTNLPEYALWCETANRVRGRTRNPWDPNRTSGGSSGGEAAAIASGMSPLGVGSDLSGSIRLPAHYCGIVGFKPSHGLVPLTGHAPELLSRFQHIGPMAHTVDDARLIWEIIAGPDGQDWYAIDAMRPHGTNTDTLRIGLLADNTFGPHDGVVTETAREATRTLESTGHAVEEVDIPILREVDYDVLTTTLYAAETERCFRDLYTHSGEMLHPVFRTRIQTPVPTREEHLEAEAAIEQLRATLTATFATYDVLIGPAAPTVAHPHQPEKLLTSGGSALRPRAALRATLPFNLTGLPALSLPFTRDEKGLPVGVQVIGGRFMDSTVLSVGALIEQRRPVREFVPGSPD